MIGKLERGGGAGGEAEREDCYLIAMFCIWSGLRNTHLPYVRNSILNKNYIEKLLLDVFILSAYLQRSGEVSLLMPQKISWWPISISE